MVRRLASPPRVEGSLPDLGHGSWLLVVNHYCRPGFRAWWLAMAISAMLPREARWVMTSTLTFPDRLRSLIVTPVSRWFLRRTAELYGFVAMPAMPPRPWEVEDRAQAVRAALRLAGQPNALLALAPEGGDNPDGVLTPPPSGAGRFLWHLARHGLRLLPIGVFEEDGRLCLKIGAPFDLPPDLSPPVEETASRRVMSAIAGCLPPHLRGTFG